jgi:hypothetical protein
MDITAIGKVLTKLRCFQHNRYKYNQQLPILALGDITPKQWRAIVSYLALHLSQLLLEGFTDPKTITLK